MNRTRRLGLCLLLLAGASAIATAQWKPLRPPAAPLVAHDPYFSIWSMADALPEDGTRHWTGRPHSLGLLARIDGKTFSLVGSSGRRDPAAGPALRQTRLEVLPTRTLYELEGGGVALKLTFFTPALPEDLDALSRPVTYVVWEARATDGRPHQTAVYIDAAADIVVNTADQPVTWARFRLGRLDVLRMGSLEQPVLAKNGDDLRIDWGYLYLSTEGGEGVSSVVQERAQSRQVFARTGTLLPTDDLSGFRPAEQRTPALAFAFDLGQVTARPVARRVMLAYDDLYSIVYFERRLRPYWRRNGADAADMLLAAHRQYESLAGRSEKFDEELMADLRRAGGEKYARLCALAYRQALAAHKLAVDADGTLLYFPKENNSNGCIGTVDVFYPGAPMFLLLNPRLMRASVQPILDYAKLPRWRFPFAPHDLGRYPHANGQVYGGGELTEDRQMPVEESGNMLLLMAAIAHVERNAEYAQRYWPLLTKWALFLKEKGLDPENQLSTDDFAGHLAHNANLSIKAILALASYGKLCGMTGRMEEASEYEGLARGYAKEWMKLARDEGHYRLAFDKPGTWSQKYNLVWDRLLGLNIFPPEVARTELAYYKTKQNTYGLPLDNRSEYTKLDWILWTATLAENQQDFETFVAPAYRFADETPTRVPLSDWYWTQDGRQRGFKARSVVGGLFIKMLADAGLWRKWAARAGWNPER